MANVNVGSASGTASGVTSTTTTTTGTTNSTVTWAPTISSSHHPQHPHPQHHHPTHPAHPHAHPHAHAHHVHGHHAHPHTHIDQDAEIDIIMAKIEQASFLLNRSSVTDTSSPPIMPFFIPSQDNRVLAELENSRTSAAALTSKFTQSK